MDDPSHGDSVRSEATFTLQEGHWLPAMRPNDASDLAPSGPLRESKSAGEPVTEPSLLVDDTETKATPGVVPPLTEATTIQAPSVLDHFSEDAITEQVVSSRLAPNHVAAPMSAPPRQHSFAIYDDEEMEDDGDSERLDPAWGIQRMNTSEILGTVQRSSSFPAFTPTIPSNEPRPNDDESTAAVNSTEEPQNVHSKEQGPEISESKPVTEPARAFDWDTEEGREAGQLLDQSDVNSPELHRHDPEESRFEEGLPLIANEEAVESSQAREHTENGIDVQIPLESSEDLSFFNNNKAQDEEPPPVELTRKDTSAVISALHMEPRQVGRHAKSEEQGFFDQIQQKPSEQHANMEDQGFFSQVQQQGPSEQHAEPDEQDFFSQVQQQGLCEAQPKSAAINESEELAAPEEQDFFSQLQGPDPSAQQSQPEATNGAEDMWKAMAEDDEFLVEDMDDLLPDSEPSSPSFEAALKDTGDLQQANAPNDIPARPFPPRSSSSVYAPHQPTTTELSQLSPTHHNLGLNQAGLAARPSFQSQFQQQRPAAPQQTSSFADQAKGGYKSPYDLPMELSKTKRRPAALQQPSNTGKVIPPPPRSSSITDKPLQSPFTPTMQSGPQPSPGYPTRAASGPNAPSAPRNNSSSFFEELPVTAKPRQGSVGGQYTPQQNTRSIAPPPMAGPPAPPPKPMMQQHPQLPPQAPFSQPPAQLPPQVPPSQPADPYAQFQLRAPERLDPFSNQPIQPPATSAPTVAAVSNRYSPAPPSNLAAPRTGPSPRYSPAPPPQAANTAPVNRYASQSAVPPPSQAPPPLNRYASQPVPSPPVGTLPFQPRTSSPLVHHKSIDATNAAASLPASQLQPSLASQVAPQRISSPPVTTQTGLQEAIYSSPPPINQAVQPPRRSQTQSPSKQRPQPTPPAPQRPQGYRPASAHGHIAPMRALSEYTPSTRNLVQARAPEIEFVPPTDELLRQDPLERWKGAPVFKFGFGGKLVSTFPKHVPRYSVGAVRPLIKPTVGDVSLREAKNTVPTSAHITSFPGPLRTKGKKKELLTWINAYIDHLDATSTNVPFSQSLPDPRKRHDERILLWKIIKSMVEHDGALDSGEALKAVNAILAPDIHAVDEATATQYREDISPSMYRPSGTNARTDHVDPMTLDVIRKHLLRGNRKEAVWHAVDNRLWSHAFLIASTMPRDTWKQVVQEFVKQEVKTAGENTESLSTLYEIFAGNAEDCVDQLVSPSARAGLQMVSKVENAGPTKNALDALDKWRETLTLVINNRSHGDHQALLSLGRLLAEYGRIEAAHICFLFSRSAANPTIVGGLDDPQASIVLLGADHRKQPHDFSRDRESILLTEVYEFATLVLTGSATSFMPFLSTYKLHHASLLADQGYKTEAQAYCDSLTSTLKSAKVSAYYAPAFLGELEDFSNRLKQVPVQASSSWMGKPNLEKVSGSLLSKLSNFVAGEDSDADSKGSTREPGESGPFARVSGTPSLSRTASQSELVGYPTSTPQPIPNTIAGSRYAPNGIASARSSSELTRGRPSLDSQRSPPSTSHANRRPSAYEPINMMQQGVATPPANPYSSFTSPPANRYQATPPQSSYMPNASSGYSPAKPENVQESYIPTPPPEQLQAPFDPVGMQQTSYEPSAPPQQSSYEPYGAQTSAYEPSASYEPSPQKFDSSYEPADDVRQQSYEPTAPAATFEANPPPYQPSFGGYAPPEQSTFMPPSTTETNGPGEAEPDHSYGGYAPPDSGYTPYVPEPDSPEEQKPKRRQFGNDDDASTNFSRPPVPAQDDSAAKKAANDAAADAAFRAAAEADAAKDNKSLKPKSSGWFGGWLGGAKKSDSLDAGAPSSSKGGKEPAVHRAKLGESKMKLYYDKDLKKWVNPDNPDAVKSTPTPPPPRAASGTPGSLGGGGGGPGGMPPPPRSVSAAAALAPTSNPGFIPPPLPVGSGPPSRVGTPATSGNSPAPSGAAIAFGEKGPGQGLVPGGPPSRPGTAVSNASSIDDLLGGGPPLGGGKRAAKGAKAKKGRYVDVMAQGG